MPREIKHRSIYLNNSQNSFSEKGNFKRDIKPKNLKQKIDIFTCIKVNIFYTKIHQKQSLKIISD